MKKDFPIFPLAFAFLISLSCSLFNGKSEDSAPPVPPQTESESAGMSRPEGQTATVIDPFSSKGQVELIDPSGPDPTPLSADSLPFSEAVQDDISMIRFIRGELTLAGLEPPSSPIDICFEERILSLSVDPDSRFFSYFLPQCGFSGVEDFAMSSTVLLKSESPMAACGYILRSRAESDYYMLRLERAEGSSRWSFLSIRDGAIGPILHPPAADDRLDLSEGAQTRVLLYARGGFMKVFFNSSFAGEISDSTLESGGIGLFVGSASGDAVCRYDALWVNVYHS
jgi:hypothetical protein